MVLLQDNILIITKFPARSQDHASSRFITPAISPDADKALRLTSYITISSVKGIVSRVPLFQGSKVPGFQCSNVPAFQGSKV